MTPAQLKANYERLWHAMVDIYRASGSRDPDVHDHGNIEAMAGHALSICANPDALGQ